MHNGHDEDASIVAVSELLELLVRATGFEPVTSTV
jgi:hypothetical protein